MTDEFYDVFAQTSPAHDVVHVGSVRAPGDRLAVQFAREVYFRRSRCERIAVVKRSHIFWSDAPEGALTDRNVGKSYRTPAFFVRRRRELAAEIPAE